MDEQIAERLRAIHPLASLRPRQREEILAAGELLRPERGERLFAQGDRDDFNLYLLQGTVRTIREETGSEDLATGSGPSNLALGNQQPRPCECVALSEDALLLKVPRQRVEDAVARSQTLAGELASMDIPGLEEAGEEDSWAHRVLQSALFRDLPTENIKRFFEEIEPVEFRAGQAVVEQGEPGDYFYMIAAGDCEVMRSVNGVEVPVASLGAGDSFGEEALISGQPRNATVRAKSRALLMRLNRERFTALFQRPMIRSITAAEAKSLIAQDACVLVDVRLEMEHETWSLPGSRNIPLYRLRRQAEELAGQLPVITYCGTGARSRVAAFLLSQRGIDTRFVEGGLAALMASPDEP